MADGPPKSRTFRWEEDGPVYRARRAVLIDGRVEYTAWVGISPYSMKDLRSGAIMRDVDGTWWKRPDEQTCKRVIHHAYPDARGEWETFEQRLLAIE